MEKRYQVFISSTFTDLQNARQEVSKALLRSDCFPAQMEQWPATDEEQFEFIKQIIHQSDYYIVISAGMYGSINPETGISYTEMEFDYAQEVGVPTIRLLHRDPFKSLIGSQIESTASAKKKLRNFHQKLKNGKLCAFWETPTELGREVILSLNDIKKRKPAQGWVRSNDVAANDALIEIANLRREVSDLKLQDAKGSTTADVEKFLNGLSGDVFLSEYELTEERADHFAFGDKTKSFRDRLYRKTTTTVQLSKAALTQGIMFGLLFSKSAEGALLQGFVSSDTDETGYPIRILGNVQMSELDELFMSLEAERLITSGDKYDSVLSLFRPSFAMSYPWALSKIARHWIINNKPARE